MTSPLRLAYAFGNHMHWVDMEWLWGYGVLPGSTRDMLHLCRTAGVKGCLNFDGIGLEKMAAEDPEALAELKQAAQEGVIEVVGGSYGQPYGLFHGGESNIRQRVQGVRTVMRLLGVRPRTFWEEEFDFHPQLPQMLRGCGFAGASLYFQWTWHTPEIPQFEEPAILWTGLDGSQIPAATRNRLNLHQWPEDFQILLDDLSANPPSAEEGTPLILQWLELMPSPDWMCRSELMLPMIQKLQADPRFEIVPMTLGEWLSSSQPKEAWKPGPSETWHGMTLGKNGDRHPQLSAHLERRLILAEACSAVLSLFGRPYQPWDLYPTWELEEGWRHLLAFQHHDNHECETLCGHVALAQAALVDRLLVEGNPLDRLARRIGLAEVEDLSFNSQSFPALAGPWEEEPIPAMGWRAGVRRFRAGWDEPWQIEGTTARWSQEGFAAEVDLASGSLLNLITPEGALDWPKGQGPLFPAEGPAWTSSGSELTFSALGLSWTWRPLPGLGCLELEVLVQEPDLEPGLKGSLRLSWPCEGEPVADGPFSVEPVGPGSRGRRKYPTGEWMTSPQWFEEVEGAFVSHSFVDFGGWMAAHSGALQWLRRGDLVEAVLLSLDPWDQGLEVMESRTHFRIWPGSSDPGQRLRRGGQLRGRMGQEDWPLASIRARGHEMLEEPGLPRVFSALQVQPSHVSVEAFYREESAMASKGLPDYALREASHPFVLRLVEWAGQEAEAVLNIAGPVARAVKTSLMGEFQEELEVGPGDDAALSPESEKLKAFGISACSIRLAMKPHEIATIYLDIVPGRKQIRDLDAKREVWATVHRT